VSKIPYYLEANYPEVVMQIEGKLCHCQAKRIKEIARDRGLPFPGCVILSFSILPQVYWGEIVKELKKEHPEIAMEAYLLS
jgi:hypothetical protein